MTHMHAYTARDRYPCHLFAPSGNARDFASVESKEKRDRANKSIEAGTDPYTAPYICIRGERPTGTCTCLNFLGYNPVARETTRRRARAYVTGEAGSRKPAAPMARSSTSRSLVPTLLDRIYSLHLRGRPGYCHRRAHAPAQIRT
jgi:hypothetical protein